MSAETPSDRLELLFSEEQLARLADTCVMVLGLGGVGSACAQTLARGGVGSFILVDRDTVAPSNINRQVLAFHSTLGREKAEVMREMILDINPEARVVIEPLYLERGRIAEQLGELPRPDYVVDAIDTISQKVEIALWCENEGIPEISSMGAANKFDPLAFRFDDIYETSVCPLAKDMRKLARKRGLRSLEVLYSTEKPRSLGRVEGGESGERLHGTTSYLPPIMGQMIASKVIRNICEADA